MHQRTRPRLLQGRFQRVAAAHVITAQHEGLDREAPRRTAQIFHVGRLALGEFMRHRAAAPLAFISCDPEGHAPEAGGPKLHFPQIHQMAPALRTPASATSPRTSRPRP